MVWLALVGCAERTILLQGVVYESHDPLSAALPEAEVRIVDFQGGELVTVTADGDGVFAATLPEGVPVFVEITAAEGFAVSTFPGTIGLEAEQLVEDHALYGVSEAERADWFERFVGCPGADTDAALVFGEMRLDGVTDPLTGGAPTIGTGSVQVSDGETEELGCYFDAEGEVYDPDSPFTGASGRFAVFGVPPGVHDFQIEGTLTTDLSKIHVYPVWVPDRERVVCPWFPALLPNLF